MVGSREAVVSWGWGDRAMFGRPTGRRAGGHTPRALSNCLPPKTHPACIRSHRSQPVIRLEPTLPAPHACETGCPCTYSVPTRTYSYAHTRRDEYLQTSSYTKNTLNVEKHTYLHSSPTITTSTPPPYLFRTYPYLLTARSVMTHPHASQHIFQPLHTGSLVHGRLWLSSGAGFLVAQHE